MDKRENAYEGRWWGGIDGFVAISTDFHYDDNEGAVIKAGERIPVRFSVCPICEGRGGYVNPAIDSHGITGEEMDEFGDEFKEDYRSGVYNIVCGLCQGHSVVPVPTNNTHVNAIMATDRAIAEDNAVYAAEARMGA